MFPGGHAQLHHDFVVVLNFKVMASQAAMQTVLKSRAALITHSNVKDAKAKSVSGRCFGYR